MASWAKGGTEQVAVRISAERAYLYEDVWRSSAQLRLLAPSFYVQARYDLMLEGPTPVLDQDLEIRDTVRDRLHFANVEVGGQLFSGPKVAGRIGLTGVLLVESPHSSDGAVAPAAFFVSELDAYPGSTARLVCTRRLGPVRGWRDTARSARNRGRLAAERRAVRRIRSPTDRRRAARRAHGRCCGEGLSTQPRPCTRVLTPCSKTAVSLSALTDVTKPGPNFT